MEFGLLTARRIRHIRSASSWRPANVDTEHGAKLPQNPASMGFSGHKDMCVNGWAVEERRRACPVACRSCEQHQWQRWNNARAALTKDALWACALLVLSGGVEHADGAVKTIFLARCPSLFWVMNRDE